MTIASQARLGGALRLPGVARLALCLLLATGAKAALAQDGSSAEDLFRRGDYEAAKELWRTEAEAGSAEATFRLARMSDLGLGMPRDPARALRGYVAAGLAGHAGAQFNAAAMYDIGSDNPRDARQAAFWYAMAAANGHARSQYALGLLFEHGDGVPRNPDIARHWFGRAAQSLEEAAQAIERLGPAAPRGQRLLPPEIMGSNAVETGGRWRVDLVWAAPPGPAGAAFLVELVTVPSGRGGGGETVASLETEASAVTLDITRDPAGLVWRVSRILGDRSDYAAGRWATVGFAARPDADPLTAPKGRVTIRTGRNDEAARRLAREIAQGLSRGGVWTRVLAVDSVPAKSAVRYRYARDADLASGIADYLPVLGAEGAERRAGLTVAPGEVVVTLVGGPAATGRP